MLPPDGCPIRRRHILPAATRPHGCSNSSVARGTFATVIASGAIVEPDAEVLDAGALLLGVHAGAAVRTASVRGRPRRRLPGVDLHCLRPRTPAHDLSRVRPAAGAASSRSGRDGWQARRLTAPTSGSPLSPGSPPPPARPVTLLAPVPPARRPVPTHRPVVAAAEPGAAYRDEVHNAPRQPGQDRPVDAERSAPREFGAVTEALRAALPHPRPEVVLAETRGPVRLAPHSFAVTATVT